MPKENRRAIEFANVSASFGNHLILKDITFEVLEGEYVGIIGPNGAGKTTLLQLLVGALKPLSGTIRIFNETITNAIKHRHIGYVPQRFAESHGSFPASVKEIVESGSNQRGVNLEKIFSLSDILHLRNRRIESLSGGERQRVFIARALAGSPQILLLDEPLTGVDTASQTSFYTFLRQLHHRNKLTVVFVSHDVDTLTNEVDTVICLNQTLVCHVPFGEFQRSEALQELAGHKFKHFHHDHSSQKK